MTHVSHLVALFLSLSGQVPGNTDALKTVAERSEYRATARMTKSSRGARHLPRRHRLHTFQSSAAHQKAARSRS